MSWQYPRTLLSPAFLTPLRGRILTLSPLAHGSRPSITTCGVTRGSMCSGSMRSFPPRHAIGDRPHDPQEPPENRTTELLPEPSARYRWSSPPPAAPDRVTPNNLYPPNIAVLDFLARRTARAPSRKCCSTTPVASEVLLVYAPRSRPHPRPRLRRLELPRRSTAERFLRRFGLDGVGAGVRERPGIICR